MSFRRLVSSYSLSLHHSLFSSGLELADLLVSSDLLNLSCTSISSLFLGDFDYDSQGSVKDDSIASSSSFSVRYRTQLGQNYNVIAFASFPLPSYQGETLIPSSSLQQNCSLFDFLCAKVNPSFSINQEAISIFISLFDQLSSLVNQLGVSDKPLIITGHSLGGSVAALFTLWLLENIPKSTQKLPFCITYGSPLIGDYGFQQAISDHQNWNSQFLHVVSYHDITPRLFTSPPNSLPTVNLNPQTSLYKPFGTFLLCSQSGCVCFENPDTVLELMAAIESKVGRTRNPGERLELVGIAHYGEVVEHLRSKIMYKDVSEFQGFSTSSCPEIVLQLEAIGLKSTEEPDSIYDDLIVAMKNREKTNYVSHRRRISDSTKKLNDIKINMAYLEWYKKVSKVVGMGYYDSYKSRQNPRDMDVVKYKNMLTNYWMDIVSEAERKSQKQGAPLGTRLLYAGTNYRRMVEPLDIADYYKVPGNKDYQTQGRKHHYILLQKWLEEGEKAAEDQNNAMTQKKASSLTEDSCFWAHVEGAINLCESLRNGEESDLETVESSRKYLKEFESYVMDLVNKFAVSPEVFLEKSSLMLWWNRYKLTLDQEYSSQLTEFMKNHHYRQYA